MIANERSVFSGKPQFPVEAIAWDLTMGAAQTVLGKLILKTSSSSKSCPKSVDHVGIIVYNRLYEYGTRGITKSCIPRSGIPAPAYPAFKLRRREIIGYTTKTRQDFMEWILQVKYGDYSSSFYDLIDQNCVHFAIAACKFLGVEYPSNWDNVCAWAKENKRFAHMFFKCTNPDQYASVPPMIQPIAIALHPETQNKPKEIEESRALQ